MTVTRVDPADFTWTDEDGVAGGVRRIALAATEADGAAPLDEAALLTLRHHGLDGSVLLTAGPPHEPEGFAWLHGGALDLVVAPDARGRALGTSLAAAAVPAAGGLTAWSHGNHPAAAALAVRHRLDRVRDLWVMRRTLSDLPALPPGDADGIDVRGFRAGDEDAFLAVNAAAFASHPEQGGLTRMGLDERLAEPWFDADGFLLGWRGEELVGYHWTKVHDDEPGAPYGEVYVVGVAPKAQGGGLGKRLTLAGLHHLAGRGLEQVILYVEAENAPAIAVYERLGFTHAAADTHVQYARS